MSVVQRLLTDDLKIEARADAIPKAVAVMSRLLFGGGGYRISIGAAIADAGGVANGAELAGKLNINRQSVSAELMVLRKAGLLEPLEQRDRRVYLTAQESAYWGLCVELRDEAEGRLRRRFAADIGD